MGSSPADLTQRLDRLSNDLYHWSDPLPYFDHGHFQCRAAFDEELISDARTIAMMLEVAGMAIAARSLIEAFTRLGEHASDIDRWCGSNPAPLDPDEIAPQWTYARIADGLGDPNFTILDGCYDVIDACRAAVEASVGPRKKQKSSVPKVRVTSKSSIVEWNGTKYPVTAEWAAWFQAAIDAEGRPVGLTKYVKHTRDGIAKLQSDAPDLHALLRKPPGNSKAGYYLGCF